MAVSVTATNAGLTALGSGEIDFSSDSFKIAFYDSSHTPGESVASYTATNEVSGTGYSAGGFTVTVSATGTSSGVYSVTVGTISESNLTISGIRYGIVYDDTHASDVSIYSVDFGETVDLSSSTLDVAFSGNKLIKIYQVT